MLAQKRFGIVKYVLLDLLKQEKIITIDEVMILSNERLDELDKMDRKTTKLMIANIIESARKGTN